MMKEIKKIIVLLSLIGFISCESDVPEPTLVDITIPPITFDPYIISDTVFGRKLYEQGVGFIDEKGTYYIEPENPIVTTKTSLGLSKLTNVEDYTILNLDGLQFFTGLEQLYLTGNDITSIDLTSMSELRVLALSQTSLLGIDLLKNIKLEELQFSNDISVENKLQSIDISKNVNLIFVQLENQNIQEIDVSTLVALKALRLKGNPGENFIIPAHIYSQLDIKSGVVSN